MSIYTYQEKLWLYERIGRPTKDESFYIYRLLKRNDETYTTNSNGIFFDIDTLSDDTLRDLMLYYRVLQPLIEDRPYYEED